MNCASGGKDIETTVGHTRPVQFCTGTCLPMESLNTLQCLTTVSILLCQLLIWIVPPLTSTAVFWRLGSITGQLPLIPGTATRL